MLAGSEIVIVLGIIFTELKLNIRFDLGFYQLRTRASMTKLIPTTFPFAKVDLSMKVVRCP